MVSCLAPGGLAHRLGDAEVGDQRVPAREQNVLRLDVAVHHVLGVGVGQRVGHLDQDLHGLVDRQLALAADPVTEIVPVDGGHHVVEKALGLARVVQRQDVRMLQPGRDLDLPEEALRTHGRRQLAAQHLHGDFAPVLHVLGQVHDGHAAAPQLALEQVAITQGIRDG